MAQQIGLSGLNQFIQRTFTNNQNNAATSISQIASGNRLVQAGIDPAGSAIATQIRSEIAALSQASENTQNGVNFLNTADGGLSTISDLVGRGRELAIQSANGTLSDDQRAAISQEFNAIRDEIDRVTQTTEFNGQNLLDGSLDPNASSPVNIQVGTGADPDNQINLNVISDTGTQSLGLDSLDISTAQGALDALAPLEQAQSDVTSARGQVGAVTNRLNVTNNNIDTAIENLSATENAIAGTDIVETLSNLRNSVFQTRLGISALQRNQQNESLIGRLLDTNG